MYRNNFLRYRSLVCYNFLTKTLLRAQTYRDNLFYYSVFTAKLPATIVC